VDAARTLLTCSRLSVDEIAWKVGYVEPAFFRRLFKRMTGVSPSAYRRQSQRLSGALPGPESDWAAFPGVNPPAPLHSDP